MNVSYEVPLGKVRKFVAFANEDDCTVTIGDYFKGDEGWMTSSSDFVIPCDEISVQKAREIKNAINRAFSHFKLLGD